MSDDLNPYAPSGINHGQWKPPRPLSPKSRIPAILIGAVAGCLVGAVVLAPIVRTNSDPFGHQSGALFGGISCTILALIWPRKTNADESKSTS